MNVWRVTTDTRVGRSLLVHRRQDDRPVRAVRAVERPISELTELVASPREELAVGKHRRLRVAGRKCGGRSMPTALPSSRSPSRLFAVTSKLFFSPGFATIENVTAAVGRDRHADGRIRCRPTYESDVTPVSSFAVPATTKHARRSRGLRRGEVFRRSARIESAGAASSSTGASAILGGRRVLRRGPGVLRRARRRAHARVGVFSVEETSDVASLSSLHATSADREKSRAENRGTRG